MLKINVKSFNFSLCIFILSWWKRVSNHISKLNKKSVKKEACENFGEQARTRGYPM